MSGQKACCDDQIKRNKLTIHCLLQLSLIIITP